MEEEVLKEIELKVEVLMEMYQAMEESCDELSQPSSYDKHYNIYRMKQNEMKDKIHNKFKEFRKSLRALEMKIIDSLYMNYQQYEDKFTQAYKNNNKMINEVQGWIDRAKNSLDDYTTKTSKDPHFVAFDMIDSNNYCIADEILNQGEQIFDKVEK